MSALSRPHHVAEPVQHVQLARRTIVKGAAWSMPVIAGAVVVPGAAASVPERPVIVGTFVTRGTVFGEHTMTSSSGVRLERCEPTMEPTVFILTATIDYIGPAGGFSLAGVALMPGVPGNDRWSFVSRRPEQVVLTSTQVISCRSQFAGFGLTYNRTSTPPPTNGLWLNVTGRTADNAFTIDGLRGGADEPIIGPRRGGFADEH